MSGIATRVVAVLVLVALPWRGAAADERKDLAAYADAALTKAFPAGEPGAAVLVRWNGETVLRKGYGLANVELDVPVRPESIFDIGSVTKQFTAAAILRLAEAGKLSLSDPVTKFLPDFPTGDATVTIEQLLSHTSGIPSYTDFPEWKAQQRADVGVDALIGLFRGKPLEFVPGQHWTYSNSGYILLGAVVEKISGKTYEDYIENEILAPLAMTSTRYGHEEELVRGRVANYVKGEHGYQPAPYISLSQVYAAGALISSVDDLARWLDALETGKVVSPASRDRMLTPGTLHGGERDGVSTRYGLGMMTRDWIGKRVNEHGGGLAGCLTEVLSVPDEKLQIVILSNNDEADPSRLALRIVAKALGQPLEARQPIVLSDAGLDEYAGVYRVLEDTSYTNIFRREGSVLQVEMTYRPIVTLHPIGPDTFSIEDSLMTVHFVRDDTGVVIAADVDFGMGPISRSKRTDEPLPVKRVVATVDPAMFDQLVGVYELHPGFDLTITRDGDHLLVQPTGQDEAELFPESPDHFFVTVVDVQIDFTRDGGPTGPVTGLVMHSGGRDRPGKRKPASTDQPTGSATITPSP